jgi:hypothetical protein
LGPGIRELHQRGLIDHRLANWATALQRARNLSAHATDERVPKQDAEDLLDFLKAICEYVFVLTPKFEKYMNRRGESAKLDIEGPGVADDEGLSGLV